MRAPSSPIPSWPGNCPRIRPRINASDSRSATVTRSTSPLYSIFTCRRKCPISRLPASRAIACIGEIKSKDVMRNPGFHFQDWQPGTNWQLITGNWLLLLPVFRDVNNLMLENKQIGTILARHAHHILVVVLDPAAYHVTLSQLQAHNFLLFSQSLQIGFFFKGLVGRRGALLAKVRISSL